MGLHKAYANEGRKKHTQDIKLDGTYGGFLMKRSWSYHLNTTETEPTGGSSSLASTKNTGVKSTGTTGTQNN